MSQLPQGNHWISHFSGEVQAIFDGITKTVGRFFQWYQSSYAIIWELGKSLLTMTPPDQELSQM